MKKLLAILLSAVLLGSTVTGCGSSSSAQSQAPSKSKSSASSTVASGTATSEAVKISYLSRYANPEYPRDKYFLSRLDEFKKENPNITIEDLSTADGDAYTTKIKSSVAAGSPPDMFICSDVFPRYDWAKNNIIQDLSPLINSSEWTGPKNDDLFGGYTFKDKGLKGIYGVPNNTATFQMFVNTKLLKDNGFDVPKTWEDVLAMSDALNAKGITPVGLAAKTKDEVGNFFSDLAMKMYGTQLRDDLISGKAKWNGDEMMSVLNKMKGFIDKGVFGRDAISYDYNDAINNFSQKKVAIHYTASFHFDRFQEMPFSNDITVINMPYFKDKPENKDIWHADIFEGFCITSKPGTKEYNAACKLMTFMLSKETFNGFAKTMGGGAYPVETDFDVDKATHVMHTFMLQYATKKQTTSNMISYLNSSNIVDLTNTNLQTLFVGNNPKQIAGTLEPEFAKIYSAAK